MTVTTEHTAVALQSTTGTPARPAVARTEYRLFRVAVLRRQELGPSSARITFSSPELAGFGPGGFDQRLKVLLPQLPLDELGVPEGDWYAWWRALPEDVRPVMRTYTVRALRPATAGSDAELDVDFVLHGVGGGAAGPAASWAAAARPGDEVALVGPTVPGTGRMWGVEWAPPAEARTLLLAGDETAVPAVCAVLEQLPAGARAVAVLEVPDIADAVSIASQADVTVEWLPRGGRHGHGDLLVPRVEEIAGPLVDETSRTIALDFEDVDLDAGILWEVPEQAVATGPQCLYAWLAGEAGVVKRLRRHLVRDVGLPRASVAFMGYWREGRAEGA
ncbi:siderophore-interacting protein [Kineococcus sp. SYSU DK018]|uniref:siderophore-interacting protein n=1 Tax=Kineococcus sp. SYSU DK018 TaxID=3383139 RepID=UPI003D7D11D7